ncbi:MAG: sn-glycerol-3-phosphate ABC transporter ATP-binding protein UgpC [Gemmatimonadales bacterium]|jgi:ABC-type sugar transport system ATPase subunit
MASIRLESVGKTYPNGHVAARGLDLSIADGEFVVLVGPSGCGKSTALRMVAGLETPTDGRIIIGDADVTKLPPQERDIAMVFQSYALYPHKTVRDNLAFGLRMRRTAKPIIAERVEHAARTLGLEEFLDRKPGQLSGGQRQRVALGRAIVRDPKVFLFDEPLSNLDAKLRVQTRAELARIHKKLGATMLYVTHDQEEAMTLGDRVAVLNEGKLQQVDTPSEVYCRPANLFVAGFIGSPTMNFFRGAIQTRDRAQRFECPEFGVDFADQLSNQAPDSVTLGVRPQDIQISATAAADVTGTIDVVELLGSELLLHLHLGDEADSIRVIVPESAAVAEDQAVGLRFRRDRLHLFDAQRGARLR